jgi:hypothetical protein
MKKSKDYSFTVRKSNEIELDRIADDLSWNNPIIVVEHEHSLPIILVFYGLVDKSKELGISSKFLSKLTCGFTFSGDSTYYYDTLSNDDIIETKRKLNIFAKKVKESPWPNKGKVKVTLMSA